MCIAEREMGRSFDRSEGRQQADSSRTGDITKRPIQCCFNCALMMYARPNDTYTLPASSYVTGKESCRGYRVARPFIEDFARRHGLDEDDVFRCTPSADGGYEVCC